MALLLEGKGEKGLEKMIGHSIFLFKGRVNVLKHVLYL